MKNLLVTILCLVGMNSIIRADELPAPSITADCNGIWTSSFYKLDGYPALGDKQSSARVTDANFKNKNGEIVLDGKIITRQAYNTMKLPVYLANQTINLGNDYSLQVEFKLSKDTAMGDFIIDTPILTVAGTLLYKNTAVSSGRSHSSAVEIQEWNNSQAKMSIEWSLENTPLRTFLKSSNLLDENLYTAAAEYPNRAEMLEKFGDGQGVISKVDIGCNLTLPWKPTNKEIE